MDPRRDDAPPQFAPRAAAESSAPPPPPDAAVTARAALPAAPAEPAVADALERLARSDARAIGVLHELLAPTLLAVALRITASRADAEEVVQDALTRAWREAATFDRARGSAVAWLLTLTRNRAIDVVRARARRDSYESATQDHAPAESPATPEQSAAEAEYAALVRGVLSTLSTEQRRVLDLAYFGGLSHAEIAARLNQPLGTVKSRISQAVHKLRTGLAAQQIGPDASRVDPACTAQSSAPAPSDERSPR